MSTTEADESHGDGLTAIANALRVGEHIRQRIAP